MNSITKDYLTGIIFKEISKNIDVYRQSKTNHFDHEPYPSATDEDILDFIISIPFFDDKLKDFLIGNLMETTIIISQSWENEFIKKTQTWANSSEWLYGKDNEHDGVKAGNVHQQYLSLPY